MGQRQQVGDGDARPKHRCLEGKQWIGQHTGHSRLLGPTRGASGMGAACGCGIARPSAGVAWTAVLDYRRAQNMELCVVEVLSAQIVFFKVLGILSIGSCAAPSCGCVLDSGVLRK